MKVVFCSSEVIPYAKTGGLADVCGSLPIVLKRLGVNMSIIMPFYACVNEASFDVKKLSQDIFFTRHEGVDIYFIKHDLFFKRPYLYGDAQGDYDDNLERFSFFNRRALRLLSDIQLRADIIHCHDWQTALIPVYLKSLYKEDSFFSGIKSVFTIHNLAYQGVFPSEKFSLLGLKEELNQLVGLEFYQKINLLKGGILFSDVLTTVSPTYAQEIQKKEFGCGLEGVLRGRATPVAGILNGIDVNEWDPKKDQLIEAKYWPDNMQGKVTNKAFLQQHYGLDVNARTPLFGFVGRLSYQKGISLLMQAIEEIVAMGAQLVFQGVGEDKYQDMLIKAHQKYPKNIAVRLAFDERTAHQIYAGSDFFLIPSIYEPCGLSQMISFRYGTIPVVYKTGGLADTVMPYDAKTQQGDGFVFNSYDKDALVRAIKKAVKAYQDKEMFDSFTTHVMHYDFSWETSAHEYKKLYEQCLL
jgi:starch synthase